MTANPYSSPNLADAWNEGRDAGIAEAFAHTTRGLDEKPWKYSCRFKREASTTQKAVIIGFEVTAHSDEDTIRVVDVARLMMEVAKLEADKNSLVAGEGTK